MQLESERFTRSITESSTSTTQAPGTETPDGSALERIEREIAVFIRAVARGREVRAGGRTLRVSTPSYILLVRLHECEPQRASELARHLGLDKSTMSRHIAALEREGLIERVEDPADGRAALVRLSAEGRSSLTEARTERREALFGLLAGWSEQDRRDFARLLGQLNTDLGLTVPERAPHEGDST